MKNKLEYRFKAYQIKTDKGYEWGVDFPDVEGVRGAGDTIEEAIKNGQDNLEMHLKFMKESGQAIPEPMLEPDIDEYSGKLVLRLSKYNHKKLTEVAEKQGVSLNALLNEMISEGLSKRESKLATSQIIDELRDEIITSNNLSLKLKHN